MGSFNSPLPFNGMDLSQTYIPAETIASPWFLDQLSLSRQPMQPAQTDQFLSSGQAAAPSGESDKKSKKPSFLRLALESGVIVAASLVGEVLFGYKGAIIIGSLTSGLLSVVDQKKETGRVKPLLLLWDTALGVIPGGADSIIFSKLFGKISTDQTAKGLLRRGIATGVVDGGILGFLGEMGHALFTAKEGKSKEKGKEGNDKVKTVEAKTTEEKTNWKEVFQNSLKAGTAGLVVGGALGALITHRTKLFFLPQKTDIPDGLKHFKSPDMSPLNRFSMAFLQHSDDTILMNFHPVDKTVYRGAMPHTPKAFDRLKNHYGVDTLIDLRGLETTPKAHIEFEQAYAKHHGMQVVHIPMNTQDKPSEQEVDLLLDTLEQAERDGRKVYIHCRHGIDRTGVMTAVWEMYKGKTRDEAFANMKKYGYNSWHQKHKPAAGRFILEAPSQ
jgi:protein tyrosine phosphatase (PTP) superfamily phosphohydrolase (DUF442 family)